MNEVDAREGRRRKRGARWTQAKKEQKQGTRWTLGATDAGILLLLHLTLSTSFVCHVFKGAGVKTQGREGGREVLCVFREVLCVYEAPSTLE
jgi:hypothetical protein